MSVILVFLYANEEFFAVLEIGLYSIMLKSKFIYVHEYRISLALIVFGCLFWFGNVRF